MNREERRESSCQFQEKMSVLMLTMSNMAHLSTSLDNLLPGSYYTHGRSLLLQSHANILFFEYILSKTECHSYKIELFNQKTLFNQQKQMYLLSLLVSESPIVQLGLGLS